MAAARNRTPNARAMQETFLASLAQGWSVTRAAEAAGCHRRRFYELRDTDEAFAAEWADAYAAGTDVVVDEVRRRAVDGWDKPVFQRGQQVGVIREYSDTMLGLLVKQRDASFREKASVDVNASGSVTVEIEDRSASLADVARVLEAVGALAELGRGASVVDVPAARQVLPAPSDR